MTLTRKRRAAILLIAAVRSFTSVDSQMALKVSFFVEGLFAVLIWAFEVRLPIMLLNMHFQPVHPAE